MGENGLLEIKMIIRQFKDHWRDEDGFNFIELDYN